MSTSVTLPPSRRYLRWAVPTVAVAVAVAGFAARPLLASADSSGLPPMTAEQLVAKVAAATPQPLSGTVVYTANLGLPDVSALTDAMGGNMTVADPVNLLAGSSTLRVWTDASSRSRVSLLGTTSEYSVVHDASEAWTYSSNDRAVVHYTLSAADRARVRSGASAMPTVPAELPTPTAAASALLTQVQQYSTVSLDAASKVAGRDVYQLVVTPTSRTTLVSRVVVAVDAATDTPLRVQVWSRQDTAKPALQLGFTDVTFAMPSTTALTFSPPAGATVKQVTVPLPTRSDLSGGTSAGSEQSVEPTVTGSGWDTVVSLTGVPVTSLTGGQLSALVSPVPGSTAATKDLTDQLGSSSHGSSLSSTALYDAVTTAVPGGRLLSSALVSVLVLDDGRVLAGAVPPSTLTALAG
jgi:outer membrane lipoprotein-sorting protein